MALIRQANARTMARDAVVLDLGDLKRQAEEIEARARAEAALIIADARSQREGILAGAGEAGHKDGYARGLEEGREAGRAEGRSAAMAEVSEQLVRLDQAWSEALARFTNDRDRMLGQVRHDGLRLAVRMGEMVTKRALSARPDVVVDQVAAVLALLARPTRLTVAVHVDDLPLVRDALPSLAERFAAALHVELVADPALDRGSCIARTGGGGNESGGGEIDASIATQLERIVEALLPRDARAVPPATATEAPPEAGDDQP